jgi:hypothetical protein
MAILAGEILDPEVIESPWFQLVEGEGYGPLVAGDVG